MISKKYKRKLTENEEKENTAHRCEENGKKEGKKLELHEFQKRERQT